MGFVDAVKTCFRKYFTFSGRGARPEYWWFFLAVVLVGLIASVLDGVLFGTGHVETTETSTTVESQNGPLASIWSLVTLVPLLAAAWRRMHDTGKPGWYLLVPVLFQFASVAFMFAGIAGFSAVENNVADPEVLHGPAAMIGLTGMLVLFVAQLVFAVLILWWLTRPSDPETNQFGPPPQSATTGGIQP